MTPQIINIHLLEISLLQVSDCLSKLKSKFSYGPDLVPLAVLKNFSSSLSQPLCKIFNRLLSDVVFPNLWKVSFITPIFKSGSKGVHITDVLGN